eukprot:SAG31_NODE_47029_length_252_cov_0.581699_1_plen_37_part_10
MHARVAVGSAAKAKAKAKARAVVGRGETSGRQTSQAD